MRKKGYYPLWSNWGKSLMKSCMILFDFFSAFKLKTQPKASHRSDVCLPTCCSCIHRLPSKLIQLSAIRSFKTNYTLHQSFMCFFCYRHTLRHDGPRKRQDWAGLSCIRGFNSCVSQGTENAEAFLWWKPPLKC